jgi:hypothetical protein
MMAEHKHTPGPWVYGPDFAEWGAVADCGPDVEYVYGGSEVIAFEQREPEEQEANARLIALAPALLQQRDDLLAAADALVAAIEGDEPLGKAAVCLAALKATIARARGE